MNSASPDARESCLGGTGVRRQLAGARELAHAAGEGVRDRGGIAAAGAQLLADALELVNLSHELCDWLCAASRPGNVERVISALEMHGSRSTSRSWP
jgi:hypothetical protein